MSVISPEIFVSDYVTKVLDFARKNLHFLTLSVTLAAFKLFRMISTWLMYFFNEF